MRRTKGRKCRFSLHGVGSEEKVLCGSINASDYNYVSTLDAFGAGVSITLFQNSGSATELYAVADSKKRA